MNKNRVIVLAAVALVVAAIMAGCCTSQGAPSEFAFVSNEDSNNLNAYSIDGGTGALTQVTGSPFAGDTGPRGVAVDPSGKFLYMANESSNDISAYTINASSGALTPVPGSPFAEGEEEENYGPRGVAVDPSGKFLYVANEVGNNVSAFSIDATSGALTQITGSPFAAETGPRGVAVDPSGKYVYVTNHGDDDVSAYSITAATGALTPVPGSAFETGDTPFDVVVDPSGKFVYVTNHLSGNVSAYTLAAATGALTPVPGSPFTAGSEPHGVAVDPSGKFVYVANHASNNVSAYSINAASGALTELAGSPFADTSPQEGVTAPYGLAVDPSGKFVYVANNGTGDVSAFSLDATSGALMEVGTFAAGTGPHGVAVAQPQ